MSIPLLFLDPHTTHLYTLSLHDALPISQRSDTPSAPQALSHGWRSSCGIAPDRHPWDRDRKSTRLNSSHITNSYAVFCSKKKNVTDLRRSYDPRGSVLVHVLFPQGSTAE